MTPRSLYLLSVFVISILVYGCQDKYIMATLQPARGILKKDAAGYCSPKKVGGTYTIDKPVADSNFIQVTIDVSSPGKFSVAADSINGVWFQTAGAFSGTGETPVTLPATGKPGASGSKDFIVKFDTGSCIITVNMQPAALPAVYTLQGSPTTCIKDTVYGTYAAGASLDTSNRLIISLNVTVAGTYSISTSTVNGYSFSGSGTLTNTGIQSVTLVGKGSPLVAGADKFSITGNASTCTVPVNVVAPIAVTGIEYFPLTQNSYWNYDNLYNVGDTLGRIMIDSVNKSGNKFKVMNEVDQFIPAVTYNYRRSDSGYYEYAKVDQYTRALTFVPAIEEEILFLKSDLKSGDTWSSKEWVGTIVSKQPIYLQYKLTCINANAAITINGKTFANVVKISMQPFIRSAITYLPNSTGEEITIYYAKGIGIVYYKFLNRSFVVREWQIRNWKVY